jgi:integrase
MPSATCSLHSARKDLHRAADRVDADLVEHLARFSDPRNADAYIFPKDDEGTPLTASGWRFAFSHGVKAAGIARGLTPNDLRHTAASWAISLGANVYDVQRMLGHAKPSITLDIYGELWEEGHERLAERMDAVLRAERPRPSDAAVVTLR